MIASSKDESSWKRKRKSRGDKSVLDSARHMNEEPWMPGMVKTLRPIPRFKQQDGESKNAFYYRMHNSIQAMKQQRDYENKFKVELKRDETGDTKMEDAEPDPVDQVVDDNKKKKLKDKKGIVVKTKEEKRQLRRQREKMRKKKNKRSNADNLDFDDFQDKPDFGEVVHEPPNIAFKSKRLQEDKPGKNDLLLKDKLTGGGVAKKPKKPKPSMARQVVMEAERKRVIEAY